MEFLPLCGAGAGLIIVLFSVYLAHLIRESRDKKQQRKALIAKRIATKTHITMPEYCMCFREENQKKLTKVRFCPRCGRGLTKGVRFIATPM